MKKNLGVIIALVVAGVLGRFLAPWPNFTPVLAAALFAGAHISDKKWAYLVPIATMIITDLFIGFYPDMVFQYVSLALVVLLGSSIKTVRFTNVFLTSVVASALFFLISNFGVWAVDAFNIYPNNFGGLLLCYEMGIPFAANSFLGDIAYSAVLFGGFALAQRFAPKLVMVPVKA